MPDTMKLECKELYNINRTLRTFIKNSMGLWKTTLEANSKPIAQVNIRCSIYQGDALSPLLSCTGQNPLRQIITESGYGHRFQNGVTQPRAPHGWHQAICHECARNQLTNPHHQDLQQRHRHVIRTRQVLSDGIKQRHDDHNGRGGATRGQNRRCSGQLQIPGDPTGKWQSQGGCKAVNHS